MTINTAFDDEKPALFITDITQLVKIPVARVFAPNTVQDIQELLKSTDNIISIGGGRFSMGGQIAIEDSLHIDMRSLNKILALNFEDKTITVQAGCTWREIQNEIDPHNLSISIMQTYSNFTVGGSLSVNAHGRYIGLGPLILSVKAIKIVLASGDIKNASPTENEDIFYGAIGGYGGLGIIVEATLALTDNIKISRHSVVLNIDEYYNYFEKNINKTHHAIFHNADIYPPKFTKVRLVTWFESYEPVTEKIRLIPKDKRYAIEHYFVWTVSETFSGKLRRQLYIDPLFYLFKKVVWRNYEASYDVAELEPSSREHATYVLQEYFVPPSELENFVSKMANILNRFKVNVLNISIRHAIADPGSLLAWAQTEVFAFVLYYKERVSDLDKNSVPIWTRELIDAALSCKGRYYLPYQPHATRDQFLKAYPKAQLYFKLKRKLDPHNRFSNKLLSKYYQDETTLNYESEIKTIFMNTQYRDKFFLFLQNVYNIYPENAFHLLITQHTEKFNTDNEIYEAIKQDLPKIKVFLNDVRYAIPALFKQKKEISRQTLMLYPNDKPLRGYVEIGSNGRYISDLKKHYQVENIIYIFDTPQSYSPVDIAERGSINKYGKFIAFNNYQAISEQDIPSESIDLVTSYIGLHHCPKDKLDDFVKSIYRILRPGGAFIIRDHDVTDKMMNAFVSVAHSIFNAGLNIPYQENQRELRHFDSIDNWISYLLPFGFETDNQRLLQAYDPSLNTLFKLTKI